MSSEQILTTAIPFDDGLINSIPAQCEIPALQLDAIDSHAFLHVPAVLLMPSRKNVEDTEKTAAAFLTRYGTNSGTALGCTENEALLHAINEAIERHALSRYYLSLCGLASRPELYRPSASFLEETFAHNTELLRHAKKLNIYLSHSFYDVPFCIAISPNDRHGTLSVVGSGCSTSPAIALYRAVTEQLQCSKLQGATEKLEDLAVTRMLASSACLTPLLHPCPHYNTPCIHPQNPAHSLREQIKRTIISLKSDCKTVFCHTLYQDPGFATVLQVFIPGLERFHLIRSGIPVAPQYVLSKNARQQHAQV